MSSKTNFIKTGLVKGTGAAKKIVLGFKPVKVELVNQTGLVTALKTNTMDGAYAAKRVTAGDMTYADACCTLNSDGFTIGADTDLNVAGEMVHYVAHEAVNE
jgi:hypothetical protein